MVTNPKIPPVFDWVNERVKCSSVAMFEGLRLRAQSDIAARNKYHREGEPENRFRFTEDGYGHLFSVFDSWGQSRHAVTFGLDEHQTLIVKTFPGDQQQMRATLTLTDEGQCKFRVGNEDLYPWQLLKRALEPLFFDRDSEYEQGQVSTST